MSLISKVPNDVNYIKSEARHKHLVAGDCTVVGFLYDKGRCLGSVGELGLNLAGHGLNGADSKNVHLFLDCFWNIEGLTDYGSRDCCFLLPLQNKELILLFGVAYIEGESEDDGGYSGMLGLNPQSPLVKIEGFKDMFLHPMKTPPERLGRLLIPSLKLFESKINNLHDVDWFVGPRGSEKMSRRD